MPVVERRRYFAIVLFCLLPMSALLSIGCSAVKIETGQTAEEQQDSAEERARQYRIRWSTQFEKADQKYRVQLLLDHLTQIKGWYQGVGQDVATQWRDGNRGLGEDIPASEMRTRLENSLNARKEMIKAWDELVEYSLGRLKQDRYFDQSFLDDLKKAADLYYEVSSTVEFPSADVDTYDHAIRIAGVNFDEQVEVVKRGLAIRN